jgi:F-type H+-transporting ATPase subunit b
VLFDWFTVVAQVFNFLVLLLLLRRFLYRPIQRAMQERQAKIAAQLEQAERAKQEAEREARAFRQRSEELQAERHELLDQARREAQAWRDQAVAKARQEVEQTRAQWYQALRQEQQAVWEEVRQRSVRQVCRIARRALTDLATADLEQQLIEVFLARLRRLGDDGDRSILESLRGPGAAVFRSAFAISPAMRARLLEALQERGSDEIEARFEVDPDLICGIELRVDSAKLTWSLDAYVDSLESELLEALHQGVTERDGI